MISFPGGGSLPARTLPDPPAEFLTAADTVREFANILAAGVRRVRDQAADSEPNRPIIPQISARMALSLGPK